MNTEPRAEAQPGQLANRMAAPPPAHGPQAAQPRTDRHAQGRGDLDGLRARADVGDEHAVELSEVTDCYL
jgi:hypothetical protein